MEDYPDYTDLDLVLAKCVDEIWEIYDEDNSGQLDKEETRKFVRHTLGGAMEGSTQEETINAVFDEFDEDGSGLIDRMEMICFIKKITGLEEDNIK